MDTPPTLHPDELLALPVFPLPRVVLFPGSELPLHLFEPRYKRMIADCLARGPMAIAMAQLKPGWEDNYAGRPAIQSVAGIGRIVSHERCPDGTYDIVLQGVARARLHELPAARVPYRRAQATLLHDQHEDLTDADVSALLSSATAVTRHLRQTHPRFCLELPENAPAGLLTDRLAERLIIDPESRQYLLETVSVGKRLRLLTVALAELRAQLEGCARGPLVH